MLRDYKKIVAWQRAHALTLAVYHVTKDFPSDERFGLVSQLRRAAYSTPANIAEGSGRDSNKDYLRFLYISLGSLKEAEYFLLLSHELGYLPEKDFAETTDSVNATFGALQGLIKSVKKETGVLGRFSALLLSSIILALGRFAA
jgi:four helix bundle protein